MSKPAVIIMAKQPEVGRTKTRLCPPLSTSQAAQLYEALLKDTILLASAVKEADVAIAITPPRAEPYFREISLPEHRLLPVQGESIGSCLFQVLDQMLGLGHPQALAINSDGPSLPVEYIQQALVLLHDVDLVLGPCEDGGYYLIGLKRAEAEIFREIDWSSDAVTEQTLKRAADLGLSVALLPLWYDVDYPADLTRLSRELATLPKERLPHTRRLPEKIFQLSE